MFSVFGFDISGAIIALGLAQGMTFGLVAVGLVLIYRANRVINFAHGALGGFGAALLGLMVIQWSVPYWVAFVAAIFASALAGAGVEAAVIRRLRKAPKIMSIIATFGFAQFLFAFMLAIFSQIGSGNLYPKPSGFPEFKVGALLFTQAHTAMVFLSPLVLGGLVLFLRRSHFGIGIRAAATNADAARLAAISPGRMSSLAWGIGSALSAYTAILIMPTRGFLPVNQLGPGLLLRALTAAVVARMTNLPVALAAGIAIGVIETSVFYNVSSTGVVSLCLFVIVMVALLFQTRQASREREKGTWAALQSWRPLPDALLRVWSIRNLGRILGVAVGVAAVILPFVASNRANIVFVQIMSFSLVGLSITLVTGLSGELSLGQFAIAGIGAASSYYVTVNIGNFFVGFLIAALVGAGASCIIAIPALRIRGLMLSVTTLAFALMASDWLLQQPWMMADPVDPGRPIVGDLVFDGSREYYAFALPVFAIGLWLVRNLRRSGVGRALVALRDNEDAARAFTVDAVRQKLICFTFAGAIAGLGGALFGHALARLSFAAFPVGASLDVAAMSVLGGLSILIGPVLGALYIIGVPAFLPLDSAGLAGTAFGWLLLILYAPGGIAQLVEPLRNKIIELLARREDLDARALMRGDDAPEGFAAVEVRELSFDGDGRAHEPPRSDTPVLTVRELTKAFGGVQAVRNVSLEVRDGETLGIIGPNGAGKTTLFDLISGFVRSDEGHVMFLGHDISRHSPEARGRLGLIRSFQEGALFETLTVIDTICVARERRQPTNLGAAIVGLRAADRRKEERARELVHLLGLERYGRKQIGELSTGTRRVVELACMLALEPKVLLLDEPSAGIAQRETEVLGDLLQRVKSQLGASFVVIEHDMPLITSLADRMVAMAEGSVICEGEPARVQRDPVVVSSYLGTEPLAIRRSGARVKPRRAKAKPKPKPKPKPKRQPARARGR